MSDWAPEFMAVPHCTPDDIGLSIEADAPAEMVEDINAYLHHYAAPKRGDDGKVIEGHLCLKCGEPLCGGMVGFLTGSKGGFEWGLAHGSGHCRNCRWPATLYHFVNDRHGKKLFSVRNILLQVHPEFVEKHP